MLLSRRQFAQTVCAGTIGPWIASRGREASLFDPSFEAQVNAQTGGSPLILAGNENPNGPGKAVLDAVRAGLSEVGRYPKAGSALYDRARRLSIVTTVETTEMIANKYGVKPENVLLGSGSTQILRSTTHVFCSKSAPLIAPIPAYEECAGYAAFMRYPVRTAKLTSPPELKMDVEALLHIAKGGGMVFYCNPNNPVATAIDGNTTRAFIAALGKTSPTTTVLVDEAYFDYVTMPGYETMIPLAVENPRVVVVRTFSKAYGMAGLRIGYAIGHRESIRKIKVWDDDGAVNVLGLAAARAALSQSPDVINAETRRNTEARTFTINWFKDRGYTATDSQTNFIFVDIKRPAKDFRDFCAKQGILVGRDFPPYEKTHCRISIGNIEDMRRALNVFEEALAKPPQAAS